ncbi:MAG: HAMP domain-containing sensor histidine kinase, partial [Pontixanthobacter sp.]
GFAELLDAGVAGELTEQGKEYVSAILQSVARLTDQVENVLDLSQSEAGLLPLSIKRLNMLPFVTEVVRTREDAIEAGGIALDLRGSKVSGKIDADPRQLGRAIGQLLDNAIAATPSGGKILVDLSKNKGVAQIVISDNGAGMTRQELARAMEGQIDERRQGLGIPLAKQLVESHGGTLQIESRKGEGTAAIILLP